MLILRDYQNNAVNGIKGAYLDGKTAPLLVLPTGGGKTVVFCDIARRTSERGKRVWILVHRVELLRQTSASLTKSGVEHGLINPKYTPNPEPLVQVAGVQTLINRLDKVPPPDLIIIDEAHHATAGSWRKVIEHFPDAKVLGVTATPCRGDGKGLGQEAGGVFDSLVMGPQIPDLIERGFLVKPIVYASPRRPDFSSVKIVRGDFDKKQITELIDRPTITGDAVAHYAKLCSGVPAVAFCVSVSHAEHVAEEFRAAGYKAYSVDGSMEDDERNRILDGLGDGSIEVVTSCDLISEGTDIPAIGCAIMLRPTQSLGLYIQQGGRALRTSEGKDHAIILDHVGNTFQHGFLDEVREWSLDGKKKRNGNGMNEAAIRVNMCEVCFNVHEPAPTCPFCGHKKPIKESEPLQVDGELELITEAQKKQMQKEKRMEVGRAKTLKDLQAIGKERGYHSGWARRMFAERNKKIV